jgi:hypothetical protein
LIVWDAKLSYLLECRAEYDESNLTESVLAHASSSQFGQERGKVEALDTGHGPAVVDPEISHVCS